ncbi:MAG: 23S rRNA (uracil(1939)-C(5))-methyltransferase RlmD [Halanaerobiales bacterium]|nr:23S rRNA (uracil(1939)-C(5))-methyltransferase RlmD [Halanaerobiales bacterium]
MAGNLKKGDIIELVLDNLAHGGDCVGHWSGLAVFIPGGIPGERIKAKITSCQKSYARGKILEILESSQERIEPVCPVEQECGGCQLQHMNYRAQLIHKKRVVEDLLRRIGGFKDIEVNQVIGADFPYNYRNKAQFPLSRDQRGLIATGFYQQGTHRVVFHDHCGIQHPLLNRVMKKTIEVLNEYKLTVYNEEKHRGLLRHLVIRAGICTNQALLIIVTKNALFPVGKEIANRVMQMVPELTGVIQNINPRRTNVIMGEQMVLLAGQDYYVDYIGPVQFAISPASFFQVNTLQTERLYRIIRQYARLTGQETVIDAYCGIGSIALYLAKDAGRIYGIEGVEAAINDAQKNTELNNITNCFFQTGRVESELPRLLQEGIKPDLVILDPPRKGLADPVKEALLATEPDRLIYVSCNPATLARDLAVLSRKYRIELVQPIDLFPQTHHVETVTVMQREKIIG